MPLILRELEHVCHDGDSAGYLIIGRYAEQPTLHVRVAGWYWAVFANEMEAAPIARDITFCPFCGENLKIRIRRELLREKDGVGNDGAVSYAAVGGIASDAAPNEAKSSD